MLSLEYVSGRCERVPKKQKTFENQLDFGLGTGACGIVPNIDWQRVPKMEPS